MAAMDEAKSAELIARLERLPFSRWHRSFFILAFFGIMFDAADFALFGAALPPVAREFGLGPAQSGLLATVGLVGAFLGALFWGTISDYIGRRTSFQATVGIFALFTALVAASWNVASLAVSRFLSNFGLGGEVPVTSTLASEFSPGRIRGSMTGNIMAAFPVGLIVAAVLSLAIIPTLGWRALFVVGVVPAALLFFVRRYMPESVRYLLSKGRISEAERIVGEIEQQALGRALSAEEIKALPKVRPEVAVPAGVTVLELFAPGRARTTILIWIVSFGFLWASNGILFMLPTILTQRGIPLTNAIAFQLVQAIGAILRVLELQLSDRPLRTTSGFVPLLFCRGFLPSGLRDVDGFCHLCHGVSGRLGQPGRIRPHQRVCERAASDASACDRGRLVFRYWADRLVPGSLGRGVDARLWPGRVDALYLRSVLFDRILRPHCRRSRDQGSRAGGDHRGRSPLEVP